MCERLRRRTRGFENHLEVFATGFGHSIAMSSVFEKDRWYLRPRVRSGSLNSSPPNTILAFATLREHACLLQTLKEGNVR